MVLVKTNTWLDQSTLNGIPMNNKMITFIGIMFRSFNNLRDKALYLFNTFNGT